jgi:hypothetical protein
MDLKVNQTWFVKVPGRKTLEEIVIEELTEKTAVFTLSDAETLFGLIPNKVRYKISDVDWIELKKDS